MDTTVDLRKRVLNYIQNADDKLLRLIQALAETYQSDENTVEHDLTELQKKELDARMESYQNNPENVMDWNEMKDSW